MEWKNKPVLRPAQSRERLVWAWLPTRCVDGFTRWMCTIRIVEHTVSTSNFDFSEWGFVSAYRWKRMASYRAEVEI